MHIGNLRTALYAFLIARNLGGTFILRIEDTDQSRYTEGATETIYRTLHECGLFHDEGPDIGGPAGPYIQTQRREIYTKYAELLIEKGGAYRCFCQRDDKVPESGGEDKPGQKYDGRCALLTLEQIEEKLSQKAPFVIRQKIPREGTTTFSDLIYGDITVENSTLDDNVLIKSDGLPTYNFANVVDDHLMGITHVVRGSEYLSSSPKYNLLYKSFGWPVPAYIHCPPVMRDGQHKMSKRHGDPSYEDLIAQGYLSSAILNYVALLGWSPGGERELFTLSELKEIFDIKGISKSPAIFDKAKLNYFNSAYIRALPPGEFHEAALPYLTESAALGQDTRAIASLLQQRCEKLMDIPAQIAFFVKLPSYSAEIYRNKKAKTDETLSLNILRELLPVLQEQNGWTVECIHDTLIAFAEEKGMKKATALWPLRIALSGQTVTPGGAIEICYVLGKAEALSRIEHGIKVLLHHPGMK
jgi:glutamyl-tRNA synthetase